jgi:hypothetical protein
MFYIGDTLSFSRFMSESGSYVYFALRGDFKPAEVTARLDIEPTKT